MSRVSFFALSAAVLAAAPAGAADLYRSPAPAAPYANYGSGTPIANWAGAYLGVQAGVAWGRVRNRVVGISSRNADADSGTLGIYGGVNALVGPNFVVGAEADLNYTGQAGTTLHGGGNSPYKASSDWNGTVRGRLGVGLDRFMPYFTAGLAFSDNDLKGNGGKSSDSNVGWVVGAGIEGLITDRITAKLEYLYLGMGDSAHTVGGQAVKTEISTSILRAGIGYRF